MVLKRKNMINAVKEIVKKMLKILSPEGLCSAKKRADKPCAVCIVNETFAEKKSKIKIEYFYGSLGTS